MAYASARDGARIWYTTLGEAGDWLLLVPGQGGDHTGWLEAGQRFATDHRVVLLDHRGVGRSDDSFPTHWSTRDFAADAAAVLTDLGVERAHVYGRSMGGRVSQWLAADNPDLVDTLVLGCTSIGGAHGIPRTDEATAIMSGRDPQAFMELFFSPEWITRTGRTRPPGPKAMSPTAKEKHFTASRDHDAWDAAPSIVAPTLIIHGSADILCPVGNADLLKQRIPDAEVHVIAGARHDYVEEHPETVELVKDFVARRGSRTVA